MKKRIKQVFLVVTLVSIMLNLMGCSNSDKIDGQQTDGPVTLKMVWWGGDQRKDLTLQAIQLFEQKYPNIKIETEAFSNSSGLRIDLAMKTADEAMPDIIQMNHDFFHSYSQRRLLEPFDPYIEKNIIDLSDVAPSYLESGIRDGKLYGIPAGINAYALMVNPEIFQRAGVEIPNKSYTYDELYQIAKTLKAQINEDGFYPLANFFDFNSYVRNTGSTQFNEDGTALGYENDQVFVDYFNLEKKWLEEGLLAPSEVTSGRGEKDSLMVLGQAALATIQSNNVARTSQYAGKTLQMIGAPAASPGKEGSFVKPSMYFSVSSYSPHKKEAMQFIDFITNDIEANNILMGERGVPVSSKVSDAVKQKLSVAEKQQYEYMEYLKANPSPIDPPSPQFLGGANSLFSRLSSQIKSGQMTPEEAASHFRTEANKILSGIKGE
ncbi:MAG: ABC transporter substrate-binding protein [Thermotaleaceae bacterium]